MTAATRRAARRPRGPAAALAVLGLLCGCAASGQVAGEWLGTGAARYFESPQAAEASPPSVWLNGHRYTPAKEPKVTVAPAFSTADGVREARVEIPAGTSLYGLGGAAGPLLRNGQPPTEAGTPWIMAVRPDGSAFGVLADTAWPCEAGLDGSIVFRTRAPSLPVIILEAANPTELLTALTNLIGRIEMPPAWALGFHFSAPDLPAASAAATWLRDQRIPADGLIIGDPSKPVPFQPDAKNAATKPVLDALHASGFHILGLTTPWIPFDADNPLFAEAAEVNHLLHAQDGTTYRLPWPGLEGELAAPDLTRTEPRRWWSTVTAAQAARGIDGFALFLGRDLAGARFDADPEFGGRGGWEAFRRHYPALLAQAVWTGAGGEQTGRRPVVLAPFSGPGIQRWASGTVGTGGDGAISHALGIALSGQPLVAGAFVDQKVPAAMARAAGLAAMLPMTRGSGTWAQGEPAATAAAVRAALERRSRLQPYIYTLCFYALTEAQPILRPVFFAAPADASLRAIDWAFLLGPDLLVVPPTADGTRRESPLKGWPRVSLAADEPAALPDLYLRPGAVLPLGPIAQHTTGAILDSLTLLVALDDTGRATGSLYEDEGDGFSLYKTQLRRVRYQAQQKEGAVFVQLAGLDGRIGMPHRKVEVRVLTERSVVTGEGSERGTIKIDLPGGG